jgi:molybdenum cofactor synthesis domain-containing protein
MCDIKNHSHGTAAQTVPVEDAVGMVLAHDITEIRKDEFKGAAFRKGHVITRDDIRRLKRIGKEHIFILDMADDEMHEDDAAWAMAEALMGEGMEAEGEPREGKINLLAARDGLLSVDKEALLAFNMLGEVMCATMHDNSVVSKGQVVAGTRAIPLVVKKGIVRQAVDAVRGGALRVKELGRPRVGIVITGGEVYYGRIKDAFAPVIKEKLSRFGGEVLGLYYAPDDASHIAGRLRELLEAGADLLITTGGMSVDPDDVTRQAIRDVGAIDIAYGSAVLPGAMFLSAYVRHGENGSSREVPVLGIPACGMYSKVTVFDLVLPRILAGHRIGRRELAELGHGGLCLQCKECRYPVCPFGK